MQKRLDYFPAYLWDNIPPEQSYVSFRPDIPQAIFYALQQYDHLLAFEYAEKRLLKSDVKQWKSVQLQNFILELHSICGRTLMMLNGEAYPAGELSQRSTLIARKTSQEDENYIPGYTKTAIDKNSELLTKYHGAETARLYREYCNALKQHLNQELVTIKSEMNKDFRQAFIRYIQLDPHQLLQEHPGYEAYRLAHTVLPAKDNKKQLINFCDKLIELIGANTDPFVVAAHIQRFRHLFPNSNGRLLRIVMNAFLCIQGEAPINIDLDTPFNRDKYYQIIEQSESNHSLLIEWLRNASRAMPRERLTQRLFGPRILRTVLGLTEYNTVACCHPTSLELFPLAIASSNDINLFPVHALPEQQLHEDERRLKQKAEQQIFSHQPIIVNADYLIQLSVRCLERKEHDLAAFFNLQASYFLKNQNNPAAAASRMALAGEIYSQQDRLYPAYYYLNSASQLAPASLNTTQRQLYDRYWFMPLLTTYQIATPTDENLATALRRAAALGRPQDIQLCLDHHVPVDCTDMGEKGRTALHWAVDKDQAACVQLLLKAGADPNKPNKKGETAKKLAEKSLLPEIRKLFNLPVASSSTVAAAEASLDALSIEQSKTASADASKGIPHRSKP